MPTKKVPTHPKLHGIFRQISVREVTVPEALARLKSEPLGRGQALKVTRRGEEQAIVISAKEYNDMMRRLQQLNRSSRMALLEQSQK
jgi:PHD/YefM family antitoxin component YafN of YafNO toxin-antitoxin module